MNKSWNKIQGLLILTILVSFISSLTIIYLLWNKILESVENDFLTGTNSRRFFEWKLNRLIHRTKARKSDIVLIMLDVDDFKRINDQYGHMAGDKVLKLVADFIKWNIKPEDTCCRYGGDEFAIILHNTDLSQAKIIAGLIKDQINKTEINVKGLLPFRVSVSMGIVEAKESVDVEKLMDCADMALYQSKKSGKNTVTVFEIDR